jgi:tripartite-type tricarboxylate transporter receptor subunit TctC
MMRAKAPSPKRPTSRLTAPFYRDALMKLPRRTFLSLAAGAALSAVSRFARADTYPSRPVRIIGGFPAGGTVDIIARLTGRWLAERLGQQMIIEVRPGAGSNIAAEAVVRASADGYTLLMASNANATTRHSTQS